MRVPFFDFSREYAFLQKELDDAYHRVMKKGIFVLGEEVDNFEKEFASYCGVKYAIGVNSGTDALMLSLKAMGIGKGDEVILPSNTFISCAYAVSSVGATPVFVDINQDTYIIDPEKIRKSITKKTRAIMPVHLYGYAGDNETIQDIARTYSFQILEDASQAHGAIVRGKKAGSFGDVGVFSLYPTKNLGVYSDGGVIVTNNKTVADSIRLIRNYGETKKYYYQTIGVNSRLDELQAAFARVKLRYLDMWNDRRITAASRYTSLLSGLPLTLPSSHVDKQHVYYTYVIRCKNRDGLQKYLKNNGIETLIHYPVPIHKQQVYGGLKKRITDVHVTEKVSTEILSLPLSPWITDEEISYVCNHVSSYFSRH